MAFFDNLGRKVTEAGQKMIQKTGEMSDTSRLNAQISEEEKKMNASCLEIGKLYAKLHREDPEPELKNLVQSVVQSEKTITALRESIQRIRGVRTCPSCGAEVAAGSAFCANCGNRMPAEKPPVAGDVLVCAGCGTILEPGTRFCTNCGRPAPKPAAAPAEPVIATPPVMPVVEPVAAPVEAPEPETAFVPADLEMPEGFSVPAFSDPAPVAAEEAEVSTEAEALPLPETPEVPVEEYVEAESEAVHVEEPAQAACPNCGAPIEPGDAFCMSCGTKL